MIRDYLDNFTEVIKNLFHPRESYDPFLNQLVGSRSDLKNIKRKYLKKDNSGMLDLEWRENKQSNYKYVVVGNGKDMKYYLILDDEIKINIFISIFMRMIFLNFTNPRKQVVVTNSRQFKHSCHCER